MKQISLTQGYVALVDDEDYERVSQRRWRAETHSSFNGCYVVTGNRETRISLHRFVMNAEATDLIDHINGDGLDCRKVNLRPCNHAENMRNRARHKNNKSGYKGVYWREFCGKFAGQITCNGKREHLGYFTDKILAARAYDDAAKRLFGEFARLNFS